MEVNVDFSKTSISTCQKFIILKHMYIKNYLINDYIIDKQECLSYRHTLILTL